MTEGLPSGSMRIHASHKPLEVLRMQKPAASRERPLGLWLSTEGHLRTRELRARSMLAGPAVFRMPQAVRKPLETKETTSLLLLGASRGGLGAGWFSRGGWHN